MVLRALGWRKIDSVRTRASVVGDSDESEKRFRVVYRHFDVSFIRNGEVFDFVFSIGVRSTRCDLEEFAFAVDTIKMHLTWLIRRSSAVTSSVSLQLKGNATATVDDESRVFVFLDLAEIGFSDFSVVCTHVCVHGSRLLACTHTHTQSISDDFPI